MRTTKTPQKEGGRSQGDITQECFWLGNRRGNGQKKKGPTLYAGPFLQANRKRRREIRDGRIQK